VTEECQAYFLLFLLLIKIKLTLILIEYFNRNHQEQIPKSRLYTPHYFKKK